MLPFGGCRPILIGRAHRLLEGRPGRLASPQGGLGRLDEDFHPERHETLPGARGALAAPLPSRSRMCHVPDRPWMMASATFNSAVWGIAGVVLLSFVGMNG